MDKTKSIRNNNLFIIGCGSCYSMLYKGLYPLLQAHDETKNRDRPNEREDR